MAVEITLKEIRNANGISQNELARRLEMSLANVQKIEYGKAKSIPLETLDKLCKILRCEVGDLLRFKPDDDLDAVDENISEQDMHGKKTSNEKQIEFTSPIAIIDRNENPRIQVITIDRPSPINRSVA